MAETTTTSLTPSSLKIIIVADSFDADLKDAMVTHLCSLNIEVEDFGITSYNNIGVEVGRRVSSASNPSSAVETRGLLACETHVGVRIFANKFPDVFATTCLTQDEARNNRSINNCNIFALSGMSLKEMLNFFAELMNEMPRIDASSKKHETCGVCYLVKNRELKSIDMIPGGSMKILRESPTRLLFGFKAESVEPAHNHTYEHYLMVMKGKKVFEI